MEKQFKQNLLNLRNPPKPTTFAQALLGQPSWTHKKAEQKKSDFISAGLEKKQVIESFENFAINQAVDGKFRLDQAEIVIKSLVDKKLITSLEDLFSQLTLSNEVLEVLLSNKVTEQVKVIFVTEGLRSWDEASSEFKNGFINELVMGLPLKTAEFFERMILAMKLASEEVIVYPVDNSGVDLSDDVQALISFFNPEIVITLGARATSKILNSNDRLSVVHGQFFARESEGGSNFQIVPLFHPSIIETNLNMKKTAWADMQKIMKHLKKLS